MTRTQDQLFKVDLVVAEGSAGFGLRRLVLGFQVGGVVDLAHTLAAATGGCLDQHGIAHCLCEGARFLDGIDGAVGSGHGGNAHGRHGLAGNRLVAHLLDAFGRRADPDDVVLDAHACEIGILGQEAVAGMDCLGTGILGCGDDVRHHQI